MRAGFSTLWICLQFLIASTALGQVDDRLVGVWAFDEGFQVVELLFRSDGRYQIDTRNSDPALSFSERGRYEINGQALAMTPYEYLGEPQTRRYEFGLSGGNLTLNRLDFPLSEIYQFKPGSRADVLAREQVASGLVRTWGRNIPFFGRQEYTFRPGGYYFVTNTPEDGESTPEVVRGRYVQNGTQLTIKPYGGTEAHYEIDFFGNTLALIRQEEFSGDVAAFEELPGSEAEVLAKAAEAEAFLAGDNWQVGIWEIRDGIQTVDLTLRPDGHYMATNHTEVLSGIVRGRYTLEPGRIQLLPFVGQGLYSRSNGEFGKVARTRELDYYDGELQFIDLEAISQSVTIARKRPGSEVAVMEKSSQAQTERERDGWAIGIWEVNDPMGWMEFTYRPDRRYIAKSGANGVPSQVERGRFLVAGDKVTLAPYAGLGTARGFELDLYDGELFLIGDLQRMVVARKVPGSETGVIARTLNPDAVKGERGTILGRWTANLPGQFDELVFRQDDQFRLSRCMNGSVSHDYGLYTVNMATRTLVSDSRFAEVQTHGLDFYGDTMTIFGGLAAPRTYTVNLGSVDTSIQTSFAADAAEAEVDEQWLTRVPVGPRDPNVTQIPGGEIPADPNPGRIFNSPTVLTGYRLYRRLIPGFVHFNDQGSIKSVAVTNTREWHFFPTGRVLVRFKNHRAGGSFPSTVVDVTDQWGAYRVEPKPVERDILHLYADNGILIETDLGEQAELTLEDGRRHLFWGKDFQILSEWAAEQQPTPCELPGAPEPSLMNTGLALSTDISPDEIHDAPPLNIKLAGPASGKFTLSGDTDVARSLVIERTTSLTSPTVWEPLQTNSVPAGPFSFEVPQGSSPMAFFRVRVP